MRTPIWHILLPLILGIGLQSLLPGAPLWWCAAGSAALLLLLWPLRKWGSSSAPLFSAQLALTCVALGYTLALARMPGQGGDFYGRHWQPGAQMEVRLMEMPHVSAHSVKAMAEVQQVQQGTGWRATSGRIMLFFAKEGAAGQLQAGDRLLVQATPKQPSARENPHQFSYRNYLRNKGILYQCYLPGSSYLLLRHDAGGWRARLALWRGQLLQVMQRADLSPGQRGVAEALLLGWKDDVDEETYAHFQDAGITHLLCVSGLHVGIMAVLLGWCFSWLARCHKGHLFKGLAQLAGVWAFVLLTGMAPSTLRAGIMFSCIIIGRLFFSKPPVMNSIAVSALILLLARPALLFDVGFQLSYAAVVGIVTLCPLLRHPLQQARFQERRGLWLLGKSYDLLCVTTVAQLSTLPFVLFYFHQFPLYFFIANMTVVPFASLLLASVLLLLLVAWWPAAFSAMAWIVGAELEGVEACTRWVAGLPHAMLDGIYFDGWMFALLLAALLLAGYGLTAAARQREERAAGAAEADAGGYWTAARGCLWSSALLAAALGMRGITASAHCQRQQSVTCYAAGRHTAIELMQGRRSVLLCDSLTLQQPESIDYQVANNETYHQIKERQLQPLPPYVALDTLRMAVATHANSYRLLCMARYVDSLPQPLALHYVIMADNAFVSIGDLQRLYRFDTVIIAASNSATRRAALRQQCQSLHLPYHDIALQGAWQRSLSR